MPGPEDLSSNDIACIMSEVLGKPIRFQQIPPDNYKSQLMQNGASEVHGARHHKYNVWFPGI